MGKFIDLTGQRFGRLMVIERAERPIKAKNTMQYWFCKCDCGKNTITMGQSLRNGATKSCGCLNEEVRHSRYVDLTGMKFGRLNVINLEKIENETTYWNCICDCGKEKIINGHSMKQGRTKSCGCLQKEKLLESNSLAFGIASFNKLYDNYKRSSKSRKIKFLLSKEQFKKLTSQTCYYCGKEPLQISKSKSGLGDYIYNGIDRIDSNGDYAEGNVVSCCGRCNQAKMSETYNDFIDWIEKVYDNLKKNDIFDIKME